MMYATEGPDPSFLDSLPSWAVISTVVIAVLSAIIGPAFTGHWTQRDLRSRIARDIDAWSKLPDATPTPGLPTPDGPKEKLLAHVAVLVDELTTSRREQYKQAMRDTALGLLVGLVITFVSFLIIRPRLDTYKTPVDPSFAEVLSSGLLATLSLVMLAGLFLSVTYFVATILWAIRWVTTPRHK